jgi:DNA-binding NtrC family response regulator
MASTEVLEPALLGLGGPAAPVTVAADGSVVLPLGLALDEVERRYVEATLAANQGNRTRAAQALKVGRNTLKRKARKR